MSKTIKIEGETNIKNLAGFEEFLEEFGHKSRITKQEIVLKNDGTLQLLSVLPHLVELEINRFQNSAVKFYRKELPNGLITTSVRGITSFDSINLLSSSTLPSIPMNTENSIVEALLIDSATDEIKGYRLIKVPQKIISQLINDWMTMKHNGVNNYMALSSLLQQVNPYTDKEFMKRSQYIGRECEDVTPEIVYLIGKDVA